MHKEDLPGMESLELISSMINKAKNQFSENGHLYLIWGWLVLICSLVHFVLLHFFHIEKSYLIWNICWLILIYQFIYIYRRERRKRVTTYTQEILRYVWIVFVVLMGLLNYLYIRILEQESYRIMSAGFLALYGMPTILSGIILRFRPLVLGGITCWVLCLVSPWVSNDFHLLLLSLAVLMAWIVPGYQLRKRFLKQNV